LIEKYRHNRIIVNSEKLAAFISQVKLGKKNSFCYFFLMKLNFLISFLQNIVENFANLVYLKTALLTLHCWAHNTK